MSRLVTKRTPGPEAADAQQASHGMALPRGLGMFDVTWVGVPVALVGIAFVTLSSRYLLPNRLPPMSVAASARSTTPW